MGRKYVVDGQVVEWIELIKLAEDVDSEYAEKSVKYTSEAAAVLRDYGFIIENYKED